MDINEIAERLKARQPVTDAERAFLIRNNPYALAAFMVDNNPGSVNLSLRKMGYTHLGFEPNRTALARQLEILIERQDAEALAAVAKNFVLVTDLESPDFIREFQSQFKTIDQ